MRKTVSLPLAALLVLMAGTAGAQETTPPASPAPAGSPPPAIPAPLPASPDSTLSLPGYNRRPASPSSVPGATPSPAPTVVPAAPTPQTPYVAMPQYGQGKPYIPYGIPDEDKRPDHDGSVYIPVDSWIYPEMTRLYSLGYADTLFLSLRPWTRKSVLHMLENSEDAITHSDSDEAKEIYAVLMRELAVERNDGLHTRGLVYGTEQAYTRVTAISGTILNDSFHLGQTVVNDYGRPFQNGINNITGAGYTAEYGRFSFYFRGEYQHAPSATGYSLAQAQQLSEYTDLIPYSGYNVPQDTIKAGNIGAENPFRIVEASLSFHLLGHELSAGKTDAWQGPAQGGAFAWSNNAENIYSVRINRVEPLSIPLVSRVLGPLRYDFFYGSLKGHTYPNSPYVHSEMFAFRPSSNFEFGFQRTVIFGGAGHSPVTLHTFLKGFFDINDTTGAEKFSRNDPGARFVAFNMSYRLPLMRKYVTFYVDSEAHDDVTPPSAPRRAAYRTGLFLSQFPGARKLSLRVEGISTDPGVSRSVDGSFNYIETIQRQGYTNKGFIFGDWIGREAKGGQAWLTYHLSGDEWIQVEYLHKKNARDFIKGTRDPITGTYGPGGTTQNSIEAQVVKRFLHDQLELNAKFQYERWKAPFYKSGLQTDTSTAIQVKFYPQLHVKGAH